MPQTKEDAARFWHIVERHRDLFLVSDSDKDGEMDEALAALNQVDPRLHFYIGHLDEGADLLISSEGCYDLADTITLIVSQAPPIPGVKAKAILESEALFGTRNEELFPDDENGDILFGIAQRAGDLIQARPVDFCFVFPAEEDAAQFADWIPESERTEPEGYDGKPGYPLQVIVTQNMIPSHANISGTEDRLTKIASEYRGIPDGWGFMTSWGSSPADSQPE